MNWKKEVSHSKILYFNSKVKIRKESLTIRILSLLNQGLCQLQVVLLSIKKNNKIMN